MQQLRYGIKQSHQTLKLTLDVPTRVMERARVKKANPLSAAIEDKLVEVDSASYESSRLQFDLKKAAASTPHKNLRAVVASLVHIHEHTRPPEYDPALRVAMSVGNLAGSTLLGVKARVLWPRVPNSRMEEAAQRAMRGAALHLNYGVEKTRKKSADHDSLVAEMLSARVVRLGGVWLNLDKEQPDSGRPALVTDVSRYDPKRPTFDILPQNIKSPEQQLLGLIGAIALARPEEVA